MIIYLFFSLIDILKTVKELLVMDRTNKIHEPSCRQTGYTN